jgi:hypothetical protein
MRPTFPPRPCPPPPSPPRHPGLAARERELLAALAWHCDKTRAGEDLYLAEGSVNRMLARIRRKYHAAGRPAPNQLLLVRMAILDGIVCGHEYLGLYREHHRPQPDGGRDRAGRRG